MDNLSQRIQGERFKRTLPQLYQCRCDISKRYLKPVGQQLSFLSGSSVTGKAHGSVSRYIMIPLDLLDERQKHLYSRNPGTKCMWDGESFEGMPVGCPINHKKLRTKLVDEKTGLPKPFQHPKHTIAKITKDGVVRVPRIQTHRIDDGYQLFGYFCSWNCARAYGNCHFPQQAWRIGSFIYSILLKMTNKLKDEGKLPKKYHVRAPKAAPHFATLKSYGGIYTIEEFRAINELDNGNELTCVPSWLSVVPAGIRVTEAPKVPPTFSSRHNLAEADKTKKQYYPAPQKKYLRPPIVAQPTRAAEVPNSILFCLNQAKN